MKLLKGTIVYLNPDTCKHTDNKSRAVRKVPMIVMENYTDIRNLDVLLKDTLNGNEEWYYYNRFFYPNKIKNFPKQGV